MEERGTYSKKFILNTYAAHRKYAIDIYDSQYCNKLYETITLIKYFYGPK